MKEKQECMIIFSAATAGSHRRDYEDSVVKLAKSRGKDLRIINLVDEMTAGAQSLGMGIKPTNLPNADFKTLELLKATAINRIQKIIKKEPKADYIIDGHTIFWWKNGPMSLMDQSDFDELKPDFFISVVSEPVEMLKRLTAIPEWQEKHVDLYETAIWSELEVFMSDMISKSVGKKLYLIDFDDDPLTLFSLLYDNKKPKIYISYAMTYKDNSEQKIQRFIKRLRKEAIVFKPSKVVIEKYEDYAKKNENIKSLIFNQTVRRDYRLIDQADIVVIHLPNLVYSSGIDGERMHAHTIGKTVLLYFPFDSYSPFTPYFVDKMFKKESDLLDEVRRLGKLYNK